MTPEQFRNRVQQLLADQQVILDRPNETCPEGNGVLKRYRDPVLTADHTPIFWRYDLDYRTNPHLMERLGINAVFNPGAIELDGRILSWPESRGSTARVSSRSLKRRRNRPFPLLGLPPGHARDERSRH